MNILLLEENKNEQKHIVDVLKNENISIRLESTIPKAINSIGLFKTDLALVDADYNNGLSTWVEFVDFLKKLNIQYAVFSSNGKVGTHKNGQKIISINEIPSLILSEKMC